MNEIKKFYDFNGYFFTINAVDNIKVDNVDNENLQKYLENFNLSQNRIFNKITFKNFVSNFFNAYAG